jgi:hypothetical protein
LQDIDPILLLEPTLSFAIATAILLYWWRTRSFKGVMLLLGAGAYFIAIAVKTVLNVTAYVTLVNAFGEQSFPVALLLGLETVLLEVGLAYLFAVYGARSRGVKVSDAVPYGIGLAFWENGVFVGLLTLFNLGLVYLILLSPSTIATTVYQQLQSASPSLFLPPASLLPGVLIGTLERVSSDMAHIAWGVLAVLSAVSGRKKYLAMALPMGLLDALVPFASYNVYVFEGGVFLLSAGFLYVAAKSLSKEMELTRAASPTGTGVSV